MILIETLRIKFIYVNNLDSNWKKWFVGFTDGEGNFLISLDPKNSYARFRLKIALHKDDLGVLEEI